VRIFGPEGDEVKEEWRKLHNQEFNDQYCPLNIVRVIKSRRMIWGGGDCSATEKGGGGGRTRGLGG